MKQFSQKLAVSLGFGAVAFIPTWLFFGIRHLMGPTGFWQNMILAGVGLYFLGTIQLILFITLVAFLISFWANG